MTQADRVHSTPPTNTSATNPPGPVAPTRRQLLTGALGYSRANLRAKERFLFPISVAHLQYDKNGVGENRCGTTVFLIHLGNQPMASEDFVVDASHGLDPNRIEGVDESGRGRQCHAIDVFHKRKRRTIS